MPSWGLSLGPRPSADGLHHRHSGDVYVEGLWPRLPGRGNHSHEIGSIKHKVNGAESYVPRRQKIKFNVRGFNT